MIFRKLFGRTRSKWPTNVPRLYPDVAIDDLADFFTDHDYQLVMNFPKISILPFASQNQEDPHQLFGIGLSRLMIRDLQLLRNVSIHGPEDTPKIYLEKARQYVRSIDKAGQYYLTGAAIAANDGFSLRAELWHQGTLVKHQHVQETEFPAYLQKCATLLTNMIGGSGTEDTTDRWLLARPSSPSSLMRLGYLEVGFTEADEEARNQEAESLLKEDPGFPLPRSYIDDQDRVKVRQHRFDEVAADPFDAQAHFNVFINLWQSSGVYEPHAVQYLRRAIELSPGHGKAHMCMPHAAPKQLAAKMLRHSELGYRLLPGNAFAIQNYIGNLEEQGGDSDTLCELAEEGIASDPEGPGNYQRLIELYKKMGQMKKALDVAFRLQKLYEPEMSERTRYCLQQNPVLAEAINSGKYDPAESNRSLIDWLEKQV